MARVMGMSLTRSDYRKTVAAVLGVHFLSLSHSL